MENAVEAIKMAGSVLLFLLALSIVALSFSQAREAIDALVAYNDREYITVEDSDEYYYLSKKGTYSSRIVGAESIIPALYRAYTEDYSVIFKFKNNYYIYKRDNGEEVNIIGARSSSYRKFSCL